MPQPHVIVDDQTRAMNHARCTIKAAQFVAGDLEWTVAEWLDVDDPHSQTALVLLDTAVNLLQPALDIVRHTDPAWDPSDLTLLQLVIAHIAGHDVAEDDLRRAAERLLAA